MFCPDRHWSLERCFTPPLNTILVIIFSPVILLVVLGLYLVAPLIPLAIALGLRRGRHSKTRDGNKRYY